MKEEVRKAAEAAKQAKRFAHKQAIVKRRLDRQMARIEERETKATAAKEAQRKYKE
jgi:hypothetical protein